MLRIYAAKRTAAQVINMIENVAGDVNSPPGQPMPFRDDFWRQIIASAPADAYNKFII
jgi:hypothetical protein